MSSILVIKVKGNTPQEVNKNLQIVDTYMNSSQQIFKLISSINPNFNPRIYYSEETVITKNIHDITNILKTDKTISHAIRTVEYAGHLNKV